MGGGQGHEKTAPTDSTPSPAPRGRPLPRVDAPQRTRFPGRPRLRPDQSGEPRSAPDPVAAPVGEPVAGAGPSGLYVHLTGP